MWAAATSQLLADVDRLTARYAPPLALMHDLRRMGATNPLVERSRRPLRRATLMRMAEIYAARSMVIARWPLPVSAPAS